MFAIRPGDHAVHAYTDPADQLTAVISLADWALDSGAQMMVFPPPGAIEVCTAALDGRPSTRDARATGQLRVLDSREVQLAGGRFDPARLYRTYAAATAAARASGYTGLCVSVDMRWAIDVDPDALTAFEAGAYPLFAAEDLTAMCHYDRLRFRPEHLRRACAAHPVIDRGTRLGYRRRGGTVELSGETDLANGRAFQAVLAGLGGGDHLDLTGMRFVDVAGLHAVAALTASRPRVTVSTTDHLATLLTMIGMSGAGQPSPPRTSGIRPDRTDRGS
jgi:hypothetical protein